MKRGKRMFHGVFGWCVIDMVGNGGCLINCEADVIEYYVMGKGTVRYERDKDGKQIVYVKNEELFEKEEDVPKIFSLQKLAMNLKLTQNEK